MSDNQERHDRNRKIIEEFRANAGKVGAPFENVPLLLLHTSAQERHGAGQPARIPARGRRLRGLRFQGRRRDHPDWLRNLKADPTSRSRSAPTRSPR